MSAPKLEVTATGAVSEAVRSSLIDIAIRHEGRLDPEIVVQEAANSDSPLHSRFEWDDTEAARKYRNVQAGVLIRQIKITVIRQEPETKELTLTTTREFQSLPSKRSKKGSKESDGSYERVAAIMGDPDKRAEMLATALRELASYRKRYADLTELAGVWREFDKVAES